MLRDCGMCLFIQIHVIVNFLSACTSWKALWQNVLGMIDGWLFSCTNVSCNQTSLSSFLQHHPGSHDSWADLCVEKSIAPSLGHCRTEVRSRTRDEDNRNKHIMEFSGLTKIPERSPEVIIQMTRWTSTLCQYSYGFTVNSRHFAHYLAFCSNLIGVLCAQRFQKLIYLHLFTVCFMKISPQWSEQTKFLVNHWADLLLHVYHNGKVLLLFSCLLILDIIPYTVWICTFFCPM